MPKPLFYELNVIDGGGVKHKLTGVNARTGDLLLTPPLREKHYLWGQTLNDVFPNVGWIPTLIAKHVALVTEIQNIEAILRTVKITAYDGYSFQKTTTHQEAIQRVQVTFDNARRVAKRNLEQALANPQTGHSQCQIQ